MIDAKIKFNAHKHNAKRRGIEFNLTFEQWSDIWNKSDKWNERGRGANKYCMCRVGDKGAYAIDNVFIGQGKQNVSDANIGKHDSEETKLKKSLAAKGKKHEYALGEKNVMHRPEVKAKLSLATSGEKHYNHKGVITPFGYFVTAKVASLALGIPKPTIEWRCRNNKSNFKYAIA